MVWLAPHLWLAAGWLAPLGRLWLAPRLWLGKCRLWLACLPMVAGTSLPCRALGW